MAFIQFFDATEIDKQQLQELLQTTDHSWEFIDGHISADNVNPGAEVISVFVSSTVTPEIIERMPNLRLIACRSTGFNNIDMTAANNRGITVTNVPSYGDNTVAEYVFTLLLALTRKLLPTVSAVSMGKVDSPALTGIDLHNKVLGIIGAGKIGQATARIAIGFGMRVIAYDPFPKSETAKKIGFTYETFDDVLKQADVISVHSPYTVSNKHLFRNETLNKIKRGAIFINTSRGELVDNKALIEALDSGTVSAAALDVFEGEAMVSVHEELALLRASAKPAETSEQSLELSILGKMPNVIITPHNAFNSIEAIKRINESTAFNITRFWYGEAPNKVQLSPASGRLIIVRHGESEWNALGKWTGTTDVHLTEKGFHEAALLGLALKDIKIDFAYASQQIRTLETLEGILDASQQFDVPFERSAALNERDYGDYTGKNKWEIRDAIGEDDFNQLRRNWEYPVPAGETLKNVYDRVTPFYTTVVLPKLLGGSNVLLVSHGNAIRSLIKYIENISDEDIASVEMIFGKILIYDIDDKGRSTAKQERSIDTTPTNA